MPVAFARLLRRLANRLDPQDEPEWFALYPTTGTAATNVGNTFMWRPVGKR